MLYAHLRPARYHNRTHTGFKPFACPECDAKFAQSGDLKTHVKQKHTTNNETHKCTHPGCGSAFALKQSLTRHLRTHTGEKPCGCSHCAKKFSDVGVRTRHMRTHTGEKPYGCSYCAKKFSQPGSRNRHEKNVHKEQNKRRKLGA